jgi:hypothetical protein
MGILEDSRTLPYAVRDREALGALPLGPPGTSAPEDT